MKQTPVVLLPGLHGTSELLRPFIAATPPGIRAIAVDYPTNESSFDALESFARGKLPADCIVIAESFSGPIGVRIARDARVRALVLASSFISRPVMPGIRHLAIAPFFALPLPQFVIRVLLSGYRADSAIVSSVQAVMRRLPASVIAGRVRQVLQADERAAAQTLSKPVLYLRGLDDNLVSEDSVKDVLRFCPNAEVVTIRGPHMLLQVTPNECWRAILEFAGKSGIE